MVIVRSAANDDIGAVARIHTAARRSYYREGGHEPDPALEMGVAGWRAYFDDPGNQTVVAYVTSDPEALAAGFACAQQRGNDDGLDVRP